MANFKSTCSACGYVMNEPLIACPACGAATIVEEPVSAASPADTADTEKNKRSNIKLLRKCKLVSILLAFLMLAVIVSFYSEAMLRGADKYGYYTFPKTVKMSAPMTMSLAELHTCAAVMFLISLVFFAIFFFLRHLQAKREDDIMPPDIPG